MEAEATAYVFTDPINKCLFLQRGHQNLQISVEPSRKRNSRCLDDRPYCHTPENAVETDARRGRRCGVEALVPGRARMLTTLEYTTCSRSRLSGSCTHARPRTYLSSSNSRAHTSVQATASQVVLQDAPGRNPPKSCLLLVGIDIMRIFSRDVSVPRTALCEYSVPSAF